MPLPQIEPRQDAREPWIGAHGVVPRVDLHVHHLLVALVHAAIQDLECVVPPAEGYVDGGEIEVLANGAVVGSGDLNNIGTGSSGFNNANFQSVGLTLANGAVAVPAGRHVSLRVSARRTCSTTAGHSSGWVRLWFNGAPIDQGGSRAAGTRFAATIGGVTGSYFARLASALATTAGSARSSVDVSVNSSVACPARPFTELGTWNITLP